MILEPVGGTKESLLQCLSLSFYFVAIFSESGAVFIVNKWNEGELTQIFNKCIILSVFGYGDYEKPFKVLGIQVYIYHSKIINNISYIPFNSQ